ncbi:MAG: site-specific integrase [Lentisphaeria bacterium]|jgi:integrase|nr:site-specific integrase [Lentisphaeria bacterium]
MTPKTLSFTKETLAGIAPPASGRDTYRDTKERYLYLFVTPTKKVFYFVRWYKGRTEQIRLGNFPETTVYLARRGAQEKAGAIAEGRDPAEERRAEKTAPTFGALFQRYMADYAKAHKKTWQQDEWNYVRHVEKQWGNSRVDDITPATVTKLHNRLSSRSGPVMANRIWALVRGVFSWGITHELVKGDNPCRATKANRERSRERFMDADELQRFLAVLEETDPDMRDFFNLLLETGVRKSSLMRMEWADINLDKAAWRVSGEFTKNGDPLHIPLTEQAVAILRNRKNEQCNPGDPQKIKGAEASHSPWVFPARRSGTKNGHIADVRRAWESITAKAGLPDLRIHDIRRTLGSWMAAQGASMLLIGRTLGHRDTKSTEVYARLNTEPIRQAVEQATRAMRQMAPGRLEQP